MKNIYKILVLALSMVLVLLVLSGCGSKTQTPSASNDVIRLKLGHDQAVEHPYHKGAVYFAEEVKKATNGKVQIQVFPNAQLGNELNMLDSLRLGDLDLSISAGPNASSHVPELGFFSVSYLFDSKDHFIRTMTDPQFMTDVQGKVQARNIGFRPLSFLTAGQRSYYGSKPIKTVEDLQGVKIRVMGSPIEARVWKGLGTLPTSMPFGEIYTAMQTNLINAAEGAPASYVASKHYEVAKNLSLTEHQWLVSVLWMSEKTWNRVPADVQKTMVEVAKKMTAYEINLNAEEDQKAIKDAANKKFSVNSVDKDGLKKRLASLQDEVAKELGMEKALARTRELAK